jgi:mono/diheme cytochrome c family protein
MKNPQHPWSTLVVVIFASCLAVGSAQSAPADPETLFVHRIAPLFSEKCLACHGNDGKIKGGLDMRTLASTLKGGDSEQAAFVAGKPEESPLYLAVTRAHEDDWKPMPPKENDKLYAEQVGWIKQWIEGGAPWPEEARVKEIAKANESKWSAEDGVMVKTSGGLSPEWTNRKYKPEALWAYQPVKKVPLPAAAKGGSPIDHFINAKLAAVHLAPAPAADRRTLLRRVTLDLTGLPPTSEEMAAFLADVASDTDALAKIVDRLLASPHYGERQAQHWLDVTRYADTSGFSNDFERSGAWRYRDYVVRSFNADKPYDQFVREQIAGDLMGAKSEADTPVRTDANADKSVRFTASSELVVAAGFLRMGPWESTAMNSPEVTRQQFLDDVVNHVGETFLAQPLRCAKCHDHKFDPLPTRDYYSLMACFGDTHPAELETAFAASEVRPDGREDIERARRELAALNAELDMLGRRNFDAGMAWLKERGADTSKVKFQGDGFFNTFNTFFGAIPEEKRPPRNLGLGPAEISRIAILAKYRSYHERTIERFEPIAFTVYSGAPNGYVSNKQRNGLPKPDTKATNLPMHILSDGSIDSPAAEVTPGVLSCIESLTGYPAKLSPETKSRVALAEWIADARNPLTPRVIVNRVWQQHFGRGLVATPNNFGKMGAHPSNPELLDFLAAWFVDNGWSLKKLHRLMVSSDTYRRSARHPDPDAVRKADPNSQLFASYPVRRLNAEEMRDAMLSVSGELNPAVGGVPVFPEINLEAALQPRYVMSGIALAYQPSPRPEERHRRTLYSFRMRGLPDPLLEVFNRPNADFSCERRDSTTVTPQVFALLNGQQPNDRALALALRLEREAKTAEERIARAWQLVYGRAPRDGEVLRALRYLETTTALQREHPVERVAPPKSVRRSMVGEMTGTMTEWDEPLDILAGGFVSDAKPWDVGPETRALAALCLVLFNSNEFLYVE